MVYNNSSSSRPKATLQQRKSRSTKLWQLAIGCIIAAALSGTWLGASISHHMPMLTHASNRRAPAPGAVASAATWVPGRVHDGLLHQIIQNCMQQQDTVITFTPDSIEAVAAFHASAGSAGSAHTTTASSAAPGARCPVAMIPLAAADRSIGLCTDAALYMQLLGAWVVPGDPQAAHSILQDITKCLAGQQQHKQEAAAMSQQVAAKNQAPSAARVAGHANTASTGPTAAPAAAAAGAAVLFLEPLYEPWLQWLQARPAAVAVYAPNFEQVRPEDAG